MQLHQKGRAFRNDLLRYTGFEAGCPGLVAAFFITFHHGEITKDRKIYVKMTKIVE